MRLLLPKLSRALRDDPRRPDEALEMMIEPTMMRPEDVPCPEDEPLMIHYFDAAHCLRVALKTCQQDGTPWSSDGRLREDHLRLGWRGQRWRCADG